jgi:hypothetical protein
MSRRGLRLNFVYVIVTVAVFVAGLCIEGYADGEIGPEARHNRLRRERANRLIQIKKVDNSSAMHLATRKSDGSSSANEAAQVMDAATGRRYCKQQAHKHKVVFGESWGTLLNPDEQQLWIKHNCDQSFCAKNDLAGRGIYKCVPIQSSNISAD